MMTNGIGSNIQRLRKKKGMTQEKLAQALGLTSAAVSKWECGQALPDIAILGPLAMMLETTTDELLGYRPDLTEQDVAMLLEDACDLFEGGDCAQAEIACELLLRTYPASLELAFHVASLYHLYGSSESDEEDAWERRAERGMELFERCRSSEKPSTREASLYVLAGLYLQRNRMEEALSVIEEYRQPQSDTRIMEASALARKGELAASAKLARERLEELERDRACYQEILESVEKNRHAMMSSEGESGALR